MSVDVSMTSVPPVCGPPEELFEVEVNVELDAIDDVDELCEAAEVVVDNDEGLCVVVVVVPGSVA